MSKNRQYRRAQRAFEQGRISRRAFLQSAVALGVSASAPLALGAHHAAAQAAENYVLLTIGDGLVAQIPSMLLSTAAAIVVTRMSGTADMGDEGA